MKCVRHIKISSIFLSAAVLGFIFGGSIFGKGIDNLDACSERDAIGMASDTLFNAIDLDYVTISSANVFKENGIANEEMMPGVEPTPWIVWRSISTGTYGIKIMTLDSHSGAQKGSPLNIALPLGTTPMAIRRIKYFGVAGLRGIEPVPWIVFRDYSLYTFSLTYQSDGTPIAGAPATIPLAVDTSAYGIPQCMAEISGSEFVDGKPRLFIGTSNGFIIVIADTYAAGIAVVDIQPVSPSAILELEPVPQYGYITLGALTENIIRGFHYEKGASGEPEWVFRTKFTLIDPRTTPLANFDTFGQHDAQLPDPASSLKLAFVNGTSELARAEISAVQSGRLMMDLSTESLNMNVKAIRLGSLLMLPSDELSVQFDPSFSQDSAFSGCDVNITDTVSDVCGYICGDANGDQLVNIKDITYTINYLYRDGPPPVPTQAVDVNGDTLINIKDITYLINYLYRSGPDPNCF